MKKKEKEEREKRIKEEEEKRKEKEKEIYKKQMEDYEKEKKLKDEEKKKREEEEKIKLKEKTEKFKEFQKNMEEEKRKKEEEKKKIIEEEEQKQKEIDKKKFEEFQKNLEEEKKMKEDQKKKQKEEEIQKQKELEKIRYEEYQRKMKEIENEKNMKEEEEKKKLEEELQKQKELEKKKFEEFQRNIEEEKIRKEEEKKKQIEEEIKKQKELERIRYEEFQRKLEEEKRIKEEEKKRKLEEEIQKQKELERIRYEEYQRKLEEMEEEMKKKEEEEKKKLEEEIQKQKELEQKRFEEFQKNLEEEKKKENEEKEKRLLEQQKELTEIYKSQRAARNTNNQIDNQTKELKQTLEDMCKYGNIVKNQIIEEKKVNEQKFISIELATKQGEKPNPSKDDEAMLCLGILAQNLEENGIMTAIEKKENEINEVKQEEASTSLQFLVNGLMNKPKYEFHFDFGEERNNELLTNKEEQEIFNNKLKKKLSMEYNIPEDKIIITCPEKGSYKVHVIFLSEEFDTLEQDRFINSCTQDEFKELCKLKEIQKKVIMGGVKLSLNMLDYRGNQTPNGYGVGQKRGTYDYLPPMGWKGFGLRVMDKYDNGNNDWIKMDNNPNEWAIAYHGIGKKGNTNNTEQITNLIINGGFKVGPGQGCENYDDVNHPGQKVGKGVYCTPDIKVAENYAGSSSTLINGKRYKMAFMLRVKPDRIRTSKEAPLEWILDGTTNEMRPYRILLKEE